MFNEETINKLAKAWAKNIEKEVFKKMEDKLLLEVIRLCKEELLRREEKISF